MEWLCPQPPSPRHASVVASFPLAHRAQWRFPPAQTCIKIKFGYKTDVSRNEDDNSRQKRNKWRTQKTLFCAWYLFVISINHPNDIHDWGMSLSLSHFIHVHYYLITSNSNVMCRVCVCVCDSGGYVKSETLSPGLMVVCGCSQRCVKRVKYGLFGELGGLCGYIRHT